VTRGCLQLCRNVFSFRKPSSRFEVLQLRKTLDDMLEKAGVNDEIDQLTAPTQVTQCIMMVFIVRYSTNAGKIYSDNTGNSMHYANSRC